jgi:sigma-B regulation protein RsbU (phosphoserine phosphatase)
VADVSGKGIPGAMFMMRAKTVIKNLAKSGLEIDEIFTRANEDLCKNNEADMFVTAWMGIMELDTGIVKYANAGHNPPLIKQENEFVYLKSRPNFVLGGMENIKFTKNEIKLSKNDVLYLYTDGVTEATNKEKQLFGEDKLNVILNSNSKSNSSELCRIVKEEIDLFVGEAEQFDDITMLCLKYKKSGKSIKKSMKLKPQLEEMVKIEDFLTKELESRHALMKEINQFNIVIDEVFSNLVNYSGCKEIEVDIAISDDLIKLVFKDDGVKFNPLEETKEVDISVSSEEREIGGLGFHIVKTIMDEVSYEYKKNMNQLTIIKRR